MIHVSRENPNKPGFMALNLAEFDYIQVTYKNLIITLTPESVFNAIQELIPTWRH